MLKAKERRKRDLGREGEKEERRKGKGVEYVRQGMKATDKPIDRDRDSEKKETNREKDKQTNKQTNRQCDLYI